MIYFTDLLHEGDRAVVVAMSGVLVVQVTIDEVIDMVAVRHGGMATVSPVDMIGGMCGAGMARGAGGGVAVRHADDMLFDLSGGGLMMEVAIMQIVDMAFVLHRDVAAVGAMHMGVVGAGVGHRRFLQGGARFNDDHAARTHGPERW